VIFLSGCGGGIAGDAIEDAYNKTKDNLDNSINSDTRSVDTYDINSTTSSKTIPELTLGENNVVSLYKGESRKVYFNVSDDGTVTAVVANSNSNIAIGSVDTQNNSVSILGVDDGSTTIRLNILDNDGNLVYKDISVTVSTNENNINEELPKINFYQQDASLVGTVNLDINETQIITIDIEDTNTEIVSVETLPASSNLCTDINIEGFELNKNTTQSLVEITGKKECSYKFIVSATNNFKITTTQYFDVIVNGNGTSTSDNVTNKTTETNTTANTETNTTNTETNTTRLYNFKSDGAVLDENSCIDNMYYNTQTHSPFEPTADDAINGISIKSFLQPTVPVKYSELTIYYKDNDSVISNSDSYFTKSSIFRVTYDTSWVNVSDNTIYIMYYENRTDEIPVCQRLTLDSTDSSTLTLEKVYR